MWVKKFFELVAWLALTLALLLAGRADAQSVPTYQVVRGDSWSSVAWRAGVPVCSLAAANGHRRCSSIYRASSALMVGQTLEVPGAD